MNCSVSVCFLHIVGKCTTVVVKSAVQFDSDCIFVTPAFRISRTQFLYVIVVVAVTMVIYIFY